MMILTLRNALRAKALLITFMVCIGVSGSLSAGCQAVPDTPLIQSDVKGQVTFRKDVLRHLGVQPGQKIQLDKLPDGRVVLQAELQEATIESVFGLLAGKTTKVATIEEINEAAAAGWAAED